MLKAIAVVLGATAFQLAAAGVEMSSSEIGDVVRLLLFACAFTFFISALPGARADARRAGRHPDPRYSHINRRAVTLTLRGPRDGHDQSAVPTVRP